ncbi:MAG: DUF922 domain-containing protein [Flavipsychrobacter sp.]|nr:DUF922 domain-containing protein [Flavipsychrobacter sp.]
MKYYVLAWLLLLLSHESGAQLIAWQDSTQLTWDDFKGRKPRKTKFAAATVSSVVLTYGKDSSDGSLTAEVQCLFDSRMSWKMHAKLRPYLLKHEQTHFDITELYARKLRKAIEEYRRRPDATYDDHGVYRKMYRKHVSQLNRYQNKYDRQTRHSLRKAEQHLWNVRIAKELKDTEKWATKS